MKPGNLKEKGGQGKGKTQDRLLKTATKRIGARSMVMDPGKVVVETFTHRAFTKERAFIKKEGSWG